VGMREVMNKNPRASAAIGGTLFVVAVGWVVSVMMADGNAANARVQPKAFYSADDGATWFPDDAARVTPFQTADGKTAVKAIVFKCGHGKTFCAYLERQTPASEIAAGAPKDAPKDGKPNPYASQMAYYRGGVQVKPPKTGTWVSVNDPAATKVVTPVCPEGSTDKLDLVEP
jgi:hypothetical protein